MLGRHNMENALAACAAASNAGVAPHVAMEALKQFRGVRRRMEVRGVVNGITVYDDFAHHPTAVASTLDGLRRKIGSARLIAVLEPRSNTMKLGSHREAIAQSLLAADKTWLYQPAEVKWDLAGAVATLGDKAQISSSIEGLVNSLAGEARPGDHVLIMSNGGFGGIHSRLLDALRSREAAK